MIMKKILSVYLAVVLVFSFFSEVAYAENIVPETVETSDTAASEAGTAAASAETVSETAGMSEVSVTAASGAVCEIPVRGQTQVQDQGLVLENGFFMNETLPGKAPEVQMIEAEAPETTETLPAESENAEAEALPTESESAEAEALPAESESAEAEVLPTESENAAAETLPAETENAEAETLPAEIPAEDPTDAADADMTVSGSETAPAETAPVAEEIVPTDMKPAEETQDAAQAETAQDMNAAETVKRTERDIDPEKSKGRTPSEEASEDDTGHEGKLTDEEASEDESAVETVEELPLALVSPYASVMVEGVLPSDTELIVSALPDPFNKPAPKKMMKAAAPMKAAASPSAVSAVSDGGEQTSDKTVLTYDIKLNRGGENIQPNGSVKVTFPDVPVYENGYLEIYHILDSAEAILEGKGVPFIEPEVISAFPAEAAIAYEATGLNAVYVEIFSLSDGTVGLDGNGAYIYTDSFSTFYILSGNSENGKATDTSLSVISDSSDAHTYYVAPGTHLKLRRSNLGNAWWGADKNNTDGVLFRGQYTSSFTGKVNTENVSTSFSAKKTLVGTIIGSGFTQGDYLLVDIAADARVGGQYTITCYRGLTLAAIEEKKTLTFIVMSEDDIIEQAYTSNDYPVYLKVLGNSSAGIPGEPCLSTGTTYYYASSGFTALNTSNTTTYSANASGVIVGDMVSNPYFAPAKDGTNTRGIVDINGEQTTAVLGTIDWNAFLNKIAANGKIKASNGVAVTAANAASYELVPYVVKLQTSYGLGWHIDCYIRPKDAIEVTYDPNIPDGYIASNIAIPSSASNTPPVSMTIGNPAQGDTTINLNGNVTATNAAGAAFTLKFLGWNTKSDGSGTSYNPGATGTFSEDTVLYAVWESNIAEGTLVIRKTVVTAEGSAEAPADDSFSFTVTFPTTSGSRPYTVFDDAGHSIGNGTVTSGGSISLKDGQWARITGVPKGSYSVTEAAKANYTPSSTGATGTVRGGATSTAVFTNTYFVLMNADYTVRHYQEKLDGSGYTEVTADVETKNGQIGAATAASAKTYAGFTVKPFSQGTIAADGSTVVSIYYDRQTAKLLIQNSAMSADDIAIFTVTGPRIEGGLTVAVQGGSSVTVDGLVVGGSYTVTEDTGWSYRYSPDAAAKSVSPVNSGTYTLSFTNSSETCVWLGGETVRNNTYGKAH